MILTLLAAASLQMKAFEGFSPERLAAIPIRLRKFIADKEVAGTVVLVRRNGKTVLSDAQGSAHIESKRPMKPDTIFQVMSMTKPITALAVVMCAEQGLLNLDDPVDHFLPELGKLQVRGPDGTLKPKQKRLTIRHLLTHTSGYSGNDPGGLTDEAKVKLTLAEYAKHFANEPLAAEPGERIAYSGPGFALAGRIVETASGMKLEDFMEKRIFDPLKMRDTSFFLPPEKAGRVAHTYFAENGKLVKLDNDPLRPSSKYANPAGGLYSTAADMATLIGNLHLLLSPAGVRAMTTIQSGSLLSDGSDAQGYGLGFSIVRSATGTSHLKPIGSFGHTGAFGTEFWSDPKTGIVVVFMSQSFSDRVRKTFNTMLNASFTGP